MARPAEVTVIGDGDPGRSFRAVSNQPAWTAGSRASLAALRPPCLTDLGYVWAGPAVSNFRVVRTVAVSGFRGVAALLLSPAMPPPAAMRWAPGS